MLPNMVSELPKSDGLTANVRELAGHETEMPIRGTGGCAAVPARP